MGVMRALVHIDDRHASEVYQDKQIGVRESPMGERVWRSVWDG
jgi:hypothetical protein